MNLELPKLYPITDVQLSGLSHAAQVEALIDGGARLIQLRDKDASPRDFYTSAVDAMRVARARGTRLIINDRVDIALAVGADGVHLGQDDLPPEHARRLLGDQALIGYSTHNIEQAMRALHTGASYIAIGPIFPTSSKNNPDPVVSLCTLGRIRELAGPLPLVAIGGINLENAKQVIDAGADSVAVIGALLSDNLRIAERTCEFLSQLAASRQP
ncbi:MAG: thiamine phosphate synthase [Pyrinomonadaceae bacterium]